MNKCVNCDYTTENDEKFCPNCGGEIVVDAPAAEVVGAEVSDKKHSIGMILSVAALISAGVYILLSIISGLPIIGFLVGLINPIVGLAGPILAIIGIILSWKSDKLGKILGIVALVVFIVAFVISFVFTGLAVIIALVPNVLGLVAAIVTGAG